MRVGIDVRMWSQSGVGRYIRNLVKQIYVLDTKNEYVLFAKSEDIHDIEPNITPSRWRIIPTTLRWHSAAEQLMMPSFLNSHHLDLVHFPYFSLPILYNKPFVVTIHDLIVDKFSTGMASTLPFPLYQAKLLGYKVVISVAAKKAKRILTVSNATKKEIVDHLKVSEEKIIVTYEGVDKNLKNKKIESRFKNYLLYVGNAYPHKNLKRLLDAFKEARIDNPSLKLILVGEEDYFYKELKNYVLHINLSESVIFYGKASDEELSSLYSNALALVAPSLMEGFGLPVVEAMAASCLVLASDIPVFREICKDAALYFNPLDIGQMKEKIRSVLPGHLGHFSTNIQSGLERNKIFSWEKMAEQTLQVYKDSVG